MEIKPYCCFGCKIRMWHKPSLQDKPTNANINPTAYFTLRACHLTKPHLANNVIVVLVLMEGGLDILRGSTCFWGVGFRVQLHTNELIQKA